MRASRSLRSQALTASILVGLLLVLTGAAPSGDDQLPDRVVTNPPVLSQHGIVELRTYRGEPLRVELVAYTGETVAAVLIHKSGRGRYGDFRSARTDTAQAFYEAQSPGARGAMLRALMLDGELTGQPVASAQPMELSLGL